MSARGVAMRFLIITFALFGFQAYASEPESRKANLKSEETSSDDESKPVTIPLNQIWAFNMPEARQITELEPEAYSKEAQKAPGKEGIRRIRESRIYQIQDALSKSPADGSESRQCFAVSGDGAEALANAHAVLVKNEKPTTTFRDGNNISLIFFSHISSQYIRLEKIQQQGQTISVRYSFVPHLDRDISVYFAMIPLGRLEPGKKEVKVLQSPTREEEYTKIGLKPPAERQASTVVCRSCSFEIVSKKPDK